MSTSIRRTAGWLAAVLLSLAGVLVAPIAARAATPAWPTLSSGMSGANVASAQFLLRHHGQSLTVDGAFTSGTTAAVLSFQSANNLPADGVIGPLTWGRLVVTSTSARTTTRSARCRPRSTSTGTASPSTGPGVPPPPPR